VWTREEDLLAPLMEQLERIQLPDAVIEEIIEYLKKAYAHEQAFFKTSQEALRKELDSIQNRLSKLVDMHLDGGIDSETYHSKLEEYKKRQREITSEMEAHVNADETCIITAKTVFDLAKRAKELFMSSKLGEKQQLLNFVFSNFQLEGKRLLVTLREPFLTLSTMPHQPVSLRMLDSN
jgi:L-rhamnose mutarotase